ncbi:hypothetical protein [Nocardioides terrigena]|uniref:hypothetical protein n=1 Tax=Nocardioides terrigena TaxID=424797 RepID=UPI00131F00C7|nr:hypothetical protein [Nocardioides terrigena]
MEFLTSRSNPALTSIAFAVGALAAWLVLFGVTRAGADTDKAFVDSAPFQTWVGVAALASVAFIDTLVAGIRELHDERLRASEPSAKAYVGLYLLFAAIVVVTLLGGGRGGPEVPIEHWRFIALALLLLGAAGAGPWIVLVWASHALLSRYRAEIPSLHAPASDARSVADLDGMMERLLDIRSDIAAAVGRLLALVLSAVLLSGALRAALVPDPLSEAEFPASAVLVYGAFFTVVLSLVVLPLMMSWRRTATMLLNRAYPRSVAITADDAAAKDRLLAVLDLNGSLFRSPIALTSLAAPLVTSFLAVFIPQIGN